MLSRKKAKKEFCAILKNKERKIIVYLYMMHAMQMKKKNASLTKRNKLSTIYYFLILLDFANNDRAPIL